MDIRDQILEGNLDLPRSNDFVNLFSEYNFNSLQYMWSSLWHNYLKNKSSISLTYWAERFDCPEQFNGALQSLSKLGWIISHSIPERNWAEAFLNEDLLLTYVSPDELAHVRATKKFNRYLPIFASSSRIDLVKVNGKVKLTGLEREGFAFANNSQYYYDNEYLNKYKSAIIANTNKGMRKVRELYPSMGSDEASYDAISTAIIEHISGNPELYTQGKSYLDSRGRAIKESLSKVFNPIGYKDARALLTIPE